MVVINGLFRKMAIKNQQELKKNMQNFSAFEGLM